MRWLERLKGALGRERRPHPQTMMNRFEMTGLHELSTSIEFRRDTATSLIVLFFCAIAAFIVISLWTGTFSKQETMRGIVLGTKGGQRITSAVGGTVSKIWVEQGQTVQPGQKLMTIVPQQTSAGARPLTEVNLRSLDEQRASTLERIGEIEALIAHDDGDLHDFEVSSQALTDNLLSQERDLEALIATQEKTVGKMQEYMKIGYVTRETVSAQERTRQDYRQQLASARFQATQIGTAAIERRRVVQQSRDAGRNEIAQLKRSVTDLESGIERAKSDIATDILATVPGRVAAINLREGGEVTAGDTVAALGDPDAPFTIGLQAPSKTIGLVTLGQKVVLKYDAFPFKTFGVKYGKIVSIGKQPLSLPKMGDPLPVADPTRPQQSQFLIEVQPDDKTISAYGVDRPILIGSTLTADVVVERRRLIDWVLDPIRAMRGRF